MAKPLNTLRINMGALAWNLTRVRDLVGPAVRIMAVVKADAYGHGLIPAARCFEAAGADALGVMDAHEAVRLREAGIDKPVFVLAGWRPGESGELVAHGIVPLAYDVEGLRALDEAARQQGRKAEVHLKVDTGMGRLGPRPDHADHLLAAAANLASLRVTGLATHLAEADVETGYMDEQLAVFDRITALAAAMGFTGLIRHAANSAAVVRDPRAHLDMVRPGIMLYGDPPADFLAERAGLAPAMSLTGRILQVKTLPAGVTVSYGRTWTSERETRLAVTGTGYAHGLPRLLSNRGQALVHGRRAPIRGRVCMNLTMLDVTDIPEAAVGDDAVFLGTQGAESITAGELGGLTETIGYEILCRFGAANPREYIPTNAMDPSA